MSYALLWIENVAAALLFVALIVACASRLAKRRYRMLCALLAVALVLVIYGLPTGAAMLLKFVLSIQYSPFYYWLSMLIVCLFGAVYVVRRGLRRGGESDTPNGRAWPRLKLVVAFGIAAALSVMTFWNMDLAVQVQMSALRAEAGALALSVAPARVPDRLNAALVYEQALEVMLPQDEVPEALRGLRARWWREEGPHLATESAELQIFRQQQERALVLLRRAAAMSDCFFDEAHDRFNISMVLPGLGRPRRAARLLAWNARYEATHGRLAAALRDVADVYRVAEHSERDPMLISVLATISIDTLATRTLEAVLASAEPTAEDLTAIRIETSFSAQRSLQRAFRGEEAFGLSFYGALARNEMLGSPAIFGTNLPISRVNVAPYRVFMMSQDVAAYRNFMAKMRHFAGQPYYQVQPAVLAYEASLADNSPGLLTRIIVPVLSAANKAVVEGDALHRLAMLGLAMARYYAEHKKYPDRLEDLVPDYIAAVPVDPFDGKPIKMRVAEDRIVLYSIGRDMTDDQGTERDNTVLTGDVTFSLRRWGRSD
jgi:hypothetical protein